MIKKSDLQTLIDQLPEEFDAETLWRELEKVIRPQGKSDWVSPGCTLTEEQREEVHQTYKETKPNERLSAEDFEERMQKWQESLRSHPVQS